jgi:putative ABC transport system ATP-binding protein
LANAFETHQVCKYFRKSSRAEVRAVHQVSIAIPVGGFALLNGPSGSGKTTLLALLGVLEQPTSGRVFFSGRDLSGLADLELARIRRRLGFVFQDFSLQPGLPIWENVTYPLIPTGMRRRERFVLAESLLSDLGLPGVARSRVGELSGGEQQRVAVARALAGQPEVLLADEPTSNLDPAAGQVLVDLFQRAHQAGKTIVLATHDPRWLACATHVFQLQFGELIQTPTPDFGKDDPV